MTAEPQIGETAIVTERKDTLALFVGQRGQGLAIESHCRSRVAALLGANRSVDGIGIGGLQRL